MGIYRGPNIIIDNAKLLVDASSNRSYPNSGSILYDLSPEKNNGTIYNTSFVNTEPKHFLYDSSGERIQIPSDHFPSPTSMSMSSWFNVSGGNGAVRCALHSAETQNVGDSVFWLGASSSNTYVATINATSGQANWESGDTSIPVVFNTWVKLDAVWDGSNVRVFFNGEFEVQYALTTYVNKPIAVTRIGASSDAGNYQFYGKIATMHMLYNKALTDDEVLHNYNAQVMRFI